MTRKLSAIFVISLLIVAFLSLSAFGAYKAKDDVERIKQLNRVPISSVAPVKLAGADQFINYVPSSTGEATQSLGFEQSSASLSPGYSVGTTTYDYQTNGSCNRRVDWRAASKMVKFAWMKKTDMGEPYVQRRTAYQAFNPATGGFLQAAGGSDIHALTQVSGYVNLDVEPTGKGVIGNHHTATGDGDVQAATVWYEYETTGGYFGPYRTPIPDSLMTYIEDPDDDYRYLWPSMEYQVNGTDTVTHIFAQQSKDGAGASQFIMYFRRVGSDSLGTFDYPPHFVGGVNDIAQVVTASRVSRKVALVWVAGTPDIPGDTVTQDRGQVFNDVLYQINTDMGANGSWQPKVNVSWNDTSQTMWLAHTDLSALYGTDDYVHIVWNAREAFGDAFQHVFGCRIFHASDRVMVNPRQPLVTTVADKNWDIPDDGCYGGAWNVMSAVKMSISECDGKFYTLFTQYNDIPNGIDDDCHNSNWTAGNSSGTANGELMISVSDNGGRNWDLSRNLTNSYTPHCDSTPPAGTFECDSDMWATMSRFGMLSTGLNFNLIPKVDPSGGGYAGGYYLDVFYVNDKYPGGCVQDAGVWTTNPMKWFRVACVNPVRNPVPAFTPSEIADPTWTKPSVAMDTIIKIENVGNIVLNISNIQSVRLTGAEDWLGTDITSAVISDGSDAQPNFKNMTLYLNKDANVTGPKGYDGLVIFTSDAPTSPDTLKVHLIIADSVQFPVWADIRTSHRRVILNNAGNIGKGGEDGYAFDPFDDCDTTGNTTGADDNVKIYLYDASPFVLRVNGTDTVMNSYIWDATWLDNDGFRPLKGLTVDSSGTNGYNYAYTGKFLSKDSAIALESEYYFPTHSDTSEFFVQKLKVYQYNSASVITIPGVMFGEVMDWDIPADSGVENGSAIDAPRRMMYCYGAEWKTLDSIVNNDCILADDRAGGFIYEKGYKVIGGQATASVDTIPLKGMFTGTNDNWQAATGNFPPGPLYKYLLALSGFKKWAATAPDPESVYVDLNMVAYFGQFDLAAKDTLVFIKIFAATEDQVAKGRNLGAIADQARQWIKNRRGMGNCCNMAGDANNNGSVNVQDVTYNINFLYKSGSRPQCKPEADANGSGGINVQDVTYLINKLYKGGPNPICPQ
jgi:hypothetical protein